MKIITLAFNKRVNYSLTIYGHYEFLWGIVLLLHTPYTYTLGKRNSIIIIEPPSFGIFPHRSKCVRAYFPVKNTEGKRARKKFA
jgi:hypothetical protein